MITQDDLTRLTALVTPVTKNHTLAEDAVQDSCVRLLEKGAELTPQLVYSYAVKQAKTVVRDELRERELSELATHQMLTNVGNPEHVSLDRCQVPNQAGRPRGDGGPRYQLCSWCSEPFTPKVRRGEYTKTCSMSCGAKRRHALAREERGTHIARTH